MLLRKHGAGMTEYIIAVGLIAIFLIFVVKQYGTTVNVAIQGGTTGVGSAVDNIPKASGPNGPNIDPVTGLPRPNNNNNNNNNGG
jgi:Flp pilus assembly pilin Flp